MNEQRQVVDDSVKRLVENVATAMRRRNSTICARVTLEFGQKLVAVQPVVMFAFFAHVASPQKLAFSGTSMNAL